MAKEKKKSFIKKFFGEFKTFITRGNVIDLSVGVIVGGAFTAIVNGLGNYILKPIINWFLALILGTNSLEGIYTYLNFLDQYIFLWFDIFLDKLVHYFDHIILYN